MEIEGPPAKRQGGPFFAIWMYDMGASRRPPLVIADNTAPAPSAGDRIRWLRGIYRPRPHAEVLWKVGSQRVEAIIKRRRLPFSRALARQPDGRLLERLMSGKLKLVSGENPR